MKPLLVIEHEPSSPMGWVRDWLQSRHRVWQHIRLIEGGTLPPVDEMAGAIILGGEMNVDEEALYPWLRAEKAWLSQALRQQIPLIGICLGAQLLAEVMGARVYRLPFWEIGWIDVYSDPEKHIKEGRFFSWHGYGFDIPQGAEAWLFGEHWPAQGFRTPHVLAFQFHPEAKEDFIKDCAQSLERKQLPTVTKQNAREIRAQAPEAMLKSKEWCFSQCDRWWSP